MYHLSQRIKNSLIVDIILRMGFMSKYFLYFIFGINQIRSCGIYREHFFFVEEKYNEYFL